MTSGRIGPLCSQSVNGLSSRLISFTKLPFDTPYHILMINTPITITKIRVRAQRNQLHLHLALRPGYIASSKESRNAHNTETVVKCLFYRERR